MTSSSPYDLNTRALGKAFGGASGGLGVAHERGNRAAAHAGRDGAGHADGARVGVSCPRVRAFARRLDRAIFGISFQRFFDALEQEVCAECDSLLDVGCGAWSPVRFFSSRLELTVGVDAHEPALAQSRSRNIHHEYRHTSVLDLEHAMPKQSFDCVVALDLIEHLTKDDGLRLLEAIEAIARRKVVIFTPNGFLPQDAVGDNEFQRHLSGWEVDEMRGMGYRVLGMSGWKPLRGMQAEPSWRPRSVCERLSLVTEPLVERRPQHAFQLMCVKDVG